MRQAPRKRADEVRVADFTMMVRVPQRPAAVRVYIEAERDEAERYAAETGGTLLTLPPSPPAGYTVGADGSLAPDRPIGPDHAGSGI